MRADEDHEYCEQCGDCVVCDPEHYCSKCGACDWACECDERSE